MSLKIELLGDYQLRFQEPNSNLLLLPVIELTPTNPANIPHIANIDISIEGTPDDLEKEIQSVYKSVHFNTDTLFKLSAPQRFRHSNCQWSKPLPAGVDCTLKVVVEYFESDSRGNPKIDAARKVQADCHIWTPSDIPDDSESSPLGPIIKKNQQSPISPVDADIKYHLGGLAIDLGTSNSTVTLYDPKYGTPPEYLPSEQEKELQTSFNKWLSNPPTDNLSHPSTQDWENEWQEFRQKLEQNLQPISLSNLQNLQGEKLLEALRQAEITLRSQKPWFRRLGNKCLNQIYKDTFSVPPLEWQSLIAVELDKDRRSSEIPSELEVVSLDASLPEDNPQRVRVLLGMQAYRDRRIALEKGEEIEGRFLHSPKRYFGKKREFKVSLNGREDGDLVTVNQLLQAAYAQLIELTEKYRQDNPGKTSPGSFYRAVVTYPTVASPLIRNEMAKLVEKLGIPEVRIAYDEAVSVAFFFFWKGFGGDLNVGLESFKTRCRLDGNKWYQNVLVLDIGGGTTDLALIQLTLEEIDPFTPGEERGDGGRYYKLTPKLLGSSGHLHLGGELMTLRVFLLLKAIIADRLLSAVAEGNLSEEVLKVQQTELSDDFRDANDKFKPGSLVEAVDSESHSGDRYQEALKTVEKVLPTRWRNTKPPITSARINTFYTLWDHAENAKLKLGQKREGDIPEPLFTLDGLEIAKLLEPNHIQLPPEFINSFRVELTLEQFERAIITDIKQAVQIADGLLSNAAKRKKLDELDWLILSGKTCNLALVEQELYKIFSQSNCFVWNPEKVSFEPKYTKLATSAGAMLAEKYRQLRFEPEKSKDLLRKGANQLYIDVKNLFYSLPCSFIREVIGQARIYIFETGDELYQMQAGEAIAKRRSGWQGIQLTNIIKRLDYEDKNPDFWGGYNGAQLMEELKITGEEEFRQLINIEFEINQSLDIEVLLCQGKPHYLIDVDTPSLNLAQAVEVSELISPEGKLLCDIAVNVLESANAMKTDAHTVIFRSSEDYSEQLKDFRDSKTHQPLGKGLIAELPEFPNSGKHTFFFDGKQPESWQLIGELAKPAVISDYPCKYYVSLTTTGILRIHAFDVPYWTSEDKQECLSQEGCVFRDKFNLQSEESEAGRDPFSGEH